MENKVYLYNREYYNLDEIFEKYNKLNIEQKKPFRDCLAHFTLAEILNKCNYDERIIESIIDLAEIEAALIDMYDSFCGTPMLALKGMYQRNLRKLINLTGKVVRNDDSRINKFKNGEWLLNNLVCLTIGSSFDKDILGDLSLIDYNSLSDDECMAIADNFVRDMKGEEILFYSSPKKLKKN